jgi:hypothetical protein
MAQVADGAGGYMGTDWWNRTIPEMWRALEREELTDAHQQVQDGWRSTYNTLANHLERVKQYKAKLVEAWPPEKSAAAAAYVERLDDLIDHLQDTYETATTNHDTLKNAMLALGSSRAQLKPLYDQYVANQGRILDFAAAKERLGNTGAANIMQPEVTAVDQQRLQYQAARIMVGLTSEISEATASLKQPKLYQASGRVDSGQDDPQGGSLVPPAIAPGFDTVSARDTGSPGHSRSLPLESPDRATIVRPHPGLVLDGATPAHVGPTPPPTTTHPSPNAPSTGGFAPTPPPTGTSAVKPPPPAGGREAHPGRLAPRAGNQEVHGGRPASRPLPGTGVARPSSGVIGGPPGTSGLVGHPGSAGRPAQRVNPVGGVIGGTGAASRTGTTGLSGPGYGPGYGPATGHPRRDRASTSERGGWDPDSPWATAEGVDPVLEPSPERRIDPGPAIGLDR